MKCIECGELNSNQNYCDGDCHTIILLRIRGELKLHPHNECEDCNIFLGGSNAYTIHCLNNNHGVLYCACDGCE